MPFGYYGYYFDPTYILVLIGALICMFASIGVNSAMRKYQNVRNCSGITGADAAMRILRYQGITDVRVECLNQGQGDHYDPRSRAVRLSYENYHSASVTAVAVAAHECGHAAQHHEEYAMLKIRSAFAPVANIGSSLGFPIIILGVILGWSQILIEIGIWAFALGVIFQLITLPVEFDASRRALQTVSGYGILTEEEKKGGKKVLTAAAWTYVAATAAALLQLLRLVLLFGGRRRDD
ncbi:MAG: zinc metallopeptidase [Lachnospiraceae bacterium]|nr:zinc metallopeptidase [Lachnospiraceae bacterium]